MLDLTPASEKPQQPADLTLEFGTCDAPGYHTLASLMGRDGDYAIFRKFSSLNTLNLMRLQAELLELEEQYKIALFQHHKTDGGVALASCFKALQSSKSKQKDLLDQIGVKLDVYNSALAKYAQITSMSSPRASSLEFLRDWLYGGNDGEGKAFINNGNPVEVLTWSKSHGKDFVSIANLAERDIWTSQIVAMILKVWHSTCGRRRKPSQQLGIIEYSGLESTTKLIITILSAMVPALSILALFYERDLLRRIWIMMGLTVAFAAILTVFTGAKRIEVFSATAAFAAVEVVFIGSVDTNPSSNMALAFNGSLMGSLNETFVGFLTGS